VAKKAVKIDVDDHGVVVRREISSYALSIITHGLIVLLMVLLYPLLSPHMGGGGGGGGTGSGAATVSLIGLPNGVDEQGTDSISKAGATTEDVVESTPQADSKEIITQNDEGLVNPNDKKVKPALATTGEVAAANGGTRKQERAGAAGAGGKTPGTGIGAGKGSGIGPGSGSGTGGGTGGGTGTGTGDGVGEGLGPDLSFPQSAFDRAMYNFGDCGKDDSDKGNVVSYRVIYKTGDSSPAVELSNSKFPASGSTTSRIHNLIIRSFNPSALSTGDKKARYKGVVRCDCNSSSCTLSQD